MANGRREPGFWRTQIRVIEALIVRETYTRFGRENIGFAWILVEPLIFCLGLVFLWTVVIAGGDKVDVPVIEFIMTGYAPLLMYRHCVLRTMRCMQANGELLFHRQVTILAMYVARLIVEILGTLAAFVLTMGVFIIWGMAEPPEDVALVLAGFGVYILFCIGIAFVVGALSERSETVEKIWSPLSYMTVPLSGTFYMLHWLPQEVRDILVFIPMVSGVEMIRGGYFGAGVPVFYNWQAAVATSLTLLAFGLLMLRNVRRYIEIS
jgi:capsular polysaccharide transport system permease protein